MKQALVRRLEKIETRLGSDVRRPGRLAILEQMDTLRRQALAPGDRVVVDWVETLRRDWWGRERVAAGLAEQESTYHPGRAMGPPIAHPRISVRSAQAAVISCDKRFRVLVAGRRFGKTEVALIELLRAVRGPDRVAWYVAPTYKQAKHIAWKRLKALVQPYRPLRIYETDLRIEFPWQSTIALRGADNYDSLRGEGLDFVVLDEYASMAPQAWTEVLRPSLSDRCGSALFIGTPKGLNHFYEQFQTAHHQEGWAAFQFTTEQGGNVSSAELASAAHELDERTYRQEFQASFENLGHGLVYYAFDRSRNVCPVQRQSEVALCWALDFNVNPMCSVIVQIEDYSTTEDRYYGRRAVTVRVLDEIVLPNSNTAEMCQAFLNRIHGRNNSSSPTTVRVYGDAAGSARSTAGRSDYQIIREFFRTEPGFKVSYHNKASNPHVRDRVNAVNGLLCNTQRDRRLLLDPRCKRLIRDFEQVVWKADAHDNLLPQLDKSNPELTHVSDALGYLVECEFGLQQNGGPRSTYVA
jgi:hypothetical protein